MKREILIAIGVTILFLGLAIQPSIAVQPETEIDIEPKDYLFQTIIDIANNPEVKELLEQYKPEMFKIDIDRSIYRKILLRNPRLMFNTLFTKPTITMEYLDKCYDNGIEITNIIGEDKVLEIVENIEVADKELFDGLNNIITKDEEISNRIAVINEMNKDLNSNPPPRDTIICDIGLLIVAYLYLRLWILSMLSDYLEGIFREIAALIHLIIKIPMFLRLPIFAGSYFIVWLLGCFGFPPYSIN